MGLAAVAQVVACSAFPDEFALTEEHRTTLRGLVYFNGIALIVLAAGSIAGARGSA